MDYWWDFSEELRLTSRMQNMNVGWKNLCSLETISWGNMLGLEYLKVLDNGRDLVSSSWFNEVSRWVFGGLKI